MAATTSLHPLKVLKLLVVYMPVGNFHKLFSVKKRYELNLQESDKFLRKLIHPDIYINYYNRLVRRSYIGLDLIYYELDLLRERIEIDQHPPKAPHSWSTKYNPTEYLI